jgi:transglycosylase-like protein with SLT domain
MSNRTLLAAALVSLLPAVASAQSSSADQARSPYVLAGVGAVTVDGRNIPTLGRFTKFADKAGLGFEYGLRSACTRYGAPVPIVKAIIAQESRFVEAARRDEAHLKDASIGLMQILLNTARDAGYYGTAEGLQYPQVNIEYGTKHFGTLLAAYKGDVQAAIAAYNSGSGHRFIADAVNNGFCIARQNGVCIAWYKFKKGEFGNQPYVASVLDFARKYGSTEPVPAVRGRVTTNGATPAPVVSGCSCRTRPTSTSSTAASSTRLKPMCCGARV